MIVYFTGTGNSRYCAKMLADLLEDELIDSSGYIKNGIAADLITDKPWIFVCPTYAWRIPRIFENFLKTGDFKGSDKAYFVMTCGGDTGDAGKYLKELCSEMGLEYMGLLQVTMPENYVAMFSVPGEDECKKIIEDARSVISAGAKRVSEGGFFPEWSHGVKDSFKSGKINLGFYSYYVHDKKFYVNQNCIGCGKCSELCPLNNISLEGGKPHWNGSCTHCMACICSCPKEAIEYGKKSIGKRRYLCPEYEG